MTKLTGGGFRMKRSKKLFSLLLVVFLVMGGLYSTGWAQVEPYNDRMNLVDLLIARPLGVVATAAGTCVFVVSLPFTLPTRSVDKSFDMFVVKPWKFSFVRDFPDESH
jgi:hypothetical protein